MNFTESTKNDFLEVMLYLIITNLVFTKLFTDNHPSTPLYLAIPSSSLALSSDQQSSFQTVGSLISSFCSLNTVGEGGNVDRPINWQLCFYPQLSSVFTAMDWYSIHMLHPSIC